ncbi:MAG: hypothetical protein QOE70_2907 [Chthoniobacter sp.]|nr:hypothetical protein [Chthoniobacter sp.]
MIPLSVRADPPLTLFVTPPRPLSTPVSVGPPAFSVLLRMTLLAMFAEPPRRPPLIVSVFVRSPSTLGSVNNVSVPELSVTPPPKVFAALRTTPPVPASMVIGAPALMFDAMTPETLTTFGPAPPKVSDVKFCPSTTPAESETALPPVPRTLMTPAPPVKA